MISLPKRTRLIHPERLLRPLHDWAMDVLRRLPCDGTFDQPKPLIRLTGRSLWFLVLTSFFLPRLSLEKPRQIPLLNLQVSLFGGSGAVKE